MAKSQKLILKEQIELATLNIQAKKIKLLENYYDNSFNNDIFGTPVDLSAIYSFRGQPLQPVWARDLYPAKSTTVRTHIDLDRLRNFSRYLFEVCPNYTGLIEGLANYVVGPGLAIEVDAIEDSDNPEEELIKEVSKFINQMNRGNKIPGLMRESFIRNLRDGECFLRLYPDEDFTKLRVVEPDFIRPPMNEIFDGIPEQAPWSWGIHTLGNDTQNVDLYNIIWSNQEEEQVEAPFIHHLKHGVMRNVKRGLPSSYPCNDEFMGAMKLRYANREGQKVRETIAYFRQWAQADQAAMQGLQDIAVTDLITRYNSQGASYQVPVSQQEPGQVVDIPKGMEVIPPAEGLNPESTDLALKHALRAVAARFQAPYWLVSGDADTSSYAASLTAEAPFTRSIMAMQSELGTYWQDIYHSIIEIGCQQGYLPEDTLERVEIHCVGPSPITRNMADETTCYQTLHSEGILSKTTWATKAGLDPEEERQKIENEEAQGLYPAGQNPDEEIDGEPETAGGQRQRDEK